MTNLTNAHKIDILSELAYDLIGDMECAGHLSPSAARQWRCQVDAVVLDKPELLTPGGVVVDVAEQITRAAAR